MNQREKADFTQGSILNKLIPFMMPVLGALVVSEWLIHQIAP